jgi:hypothetical protein
MPSLGRWQYTVDRDATIAAYARAELGWSGRCSCNGCRNFVAAREREHVFPSEFVGFLESVGVNPRKEGEVYHNGRLAPGRHDYGGWFHFVGALEVTGDFPVVPMGERFTVWLQQKSAPELEALKGLPLVQVEFHAENVPWLLNEAEAE